MENNKPYWIFFLGDDDEEETSDEEDDTTDEEDEEKDDSLNIEFGEEIGDDFSLSKSQTPPSIGNLSLPSVPPIHSFNRRFVSLSIGFFQ